MLALIASVLGLAALDSLNPFSVAAMAIVLTMPRPLAAGAVFIFATFLAYWAGGVAIAAGWAQALPGVLALVPPKVLWIVVLAIGVALASYGVWSWLRPPSISRKPHSAGTGVGLLGVAFFAVASTFSDLPTAVPLFAAIHAMTLARLSPVIELVLLAIYTLIYVAPLALLWAFRAARFAGLNDIFMRLESAMAWAVRRLLPPLVSAFGVYCIGIAAFELARLF